MPYCVRGKFFVGPLPPRIRDIPSRFRNKRREGKPVEVFVLLQVREGDYEKLGQQGSIAFGDGRIPDLDRMSGKFKDRERECLTIPRRQAG